MPGSSVRSRTGLHDHVCSAFDDRDDFRSAATEYLAEGLALGLRVAYVGSGSVDRLVHDLDGLPGLETLLDDGGLRVLSVEAMYGPDEVICPGDQVAAYARATAQARAEGLAGFRVAADATALVRTAEQLESFAPYEHMIDRFIARAPFSALCAYDRSVLADDRIADIACLHPVTDHEASPFQLFVVDEHTMALRGEIDMASLDLLERALDHIDFPPADACFALDCSELVFIDHRGLSAFAERAADQGTTLRLRSPSPMVLRLIELVEIPHLVTEGTTP